MLSPASSSTGKRSLEETTQGVSRKRAAVEKVEVQQESGDQLVRRLSEFRRQEKLTDVVVRCGDLCIPCHRNVLCAGSTYFDGLFSGQFSDSESATCILSTDDVAPQALEKCIDSLYAGGVTCCEDDLQSLCAAASYLCIGALLSDVADALNSRLSVNNCVSTWILADSLSLGKLASCASNFVANGFQALATEDMASEMVDAGTSLIHLPKTLMNSLLADRCNNLRVRSEQVVYEVVIKWMRAQSRSLSDEDIAELICNVRVALLPHSKAEQLLNEPLFAGSKSRKVLLKAFIAANHGKRPPCRFPDTVEIAIAQGHTPEACLERKMPFVEVFDLCKPLGSREQGVVEVITASGLRGVVKIQRDRYSHLTHLVFQQTKTPDGMLVVGAPEVPIKQADVRLLLWKQ